MLGPTQTRILHAAVRERDLERHLTWIERNCLPCICLGLGSRWRARKPAPVSRVGGVPDLPPGVRWPRAGDADYNFIAQLDLGLLPRRSPLPQRGMLYFFLGEDEPRTRVDGKVLYAPDVEAAARPAPRGAEALINEHYVEIVPHVLAAAEMGLSLPGPRSPEVGELDLDEDSEVALEELGWSLRPSGMVVQALGHLDDVDDDPRTIAAIDELGGELYDYTWRRANADRIRSAAEQWRVLFSLRSSQRLDLCFWDAYTLAYLVRAADLERCAFDAVHALLVRG
jgi:hypothetical protein